MEENTPISERENVLRFAAAHFRGAMQYDDLLREKILNQPVPNIDRKDARKFQRLLRTSDALSLLLVIWKGTAVEQLVPFQSGPSPLNAHGLAVTLAEHPADVAKITSRIREFSIAAEAYGLLKRLDGHQKLVKLEATPLLEEFLVELARRNLHDTAAS